MKSTLTPPTVAEYDRIFEAERLNEYPMVDAFEQRIGHAIDRQRMERAARVLACPVKTNPPSWQHGRVLFALTRRFIQMNPMMVGNHYNALDIGTAKGFSALCLVWAFEHASVNVHSVDVIDPDERVRRNTVAECEGLLTLRETLQSWPESELIDFHHSTGVDWLRDRSHMRINVAFVDGKHSYEAVSQEAALLSDRQRSGDVVMFDDVQIPGVAKAVASLKGYEFEYLEVKPERKYAIGVRK
jgi:predicted O-methyltransferase YrrM